MLQLPASRSFLPSIACTSELVSGLRGPTLWSAYEGGAPHRRHAQSPPECRAKAEHTRTSALLSPRPTQNCPREAPEGRVENDSFSRQYSSWKLSRHWRSRVISFLPVDAREPYAGGSSCVTDILLYCGSACFSGKLLSIGCEDPRSRETRQTSASSGDLCCAVGGRPLFSSLRKDDSSLACEVRRRTKAFVNQCFLCDMASFSRKEDIRCRAQQTAGYRTGLRVLESPVHTAMRTKPAQIEVRNRAEARKRCNRSNAGDAPGGPLGSRTNLSACRPDKGVVGLKPGLSGHTKEQESMCLSELSVLDGGRAFESPRNPTLVSTWQHMSTPEREVTYRGACRLTRDKAECLSETLQDACPQKAAKEEGSRPHDAEEYGSRRNVGVPCPSDAGGGGQSRATQVLLRQLDLHAAVKRSDSVDRVLAVCSDFLKTIAKDLGNCCTRQSCAEWNGQRVSRRRAVFRLSPDVGPCLSPAPPLLPDARDTSRFTSSPAFSTPSDRTSSVTSLPTGLSSSRDLVIGICHHIAADFGWINSAHVLHQLAVLSSSEARKKRENARLSSQLTQRNRPSFVRSRETHILTSGPEEAQPGPGVGRERGASGECLVNCSAGQIAPGNTPGIEMLACGARGRGTPERSHFPDFCREEARTQRRCFFQEEPTPSSELLRDPRFLSIFQCTLYHLRQIYGVAARRYNALWSPGDQEKALRTREVGCAGPTAMTAVREFQRVSARIPRHETNKQAPLQEIEVPVSPFSGQLAVPWHRDEPHQATFSRASSHQRYEESQKESHTWAPETCGPAGAAGLPGSQQTEPLSAFLARRREEDRPSGSMAGTLDLSEVSTVLPSRSGVPSSGRPTSAFSRAVNAVRSTAGGSSKDPIFETGDRDLGVFGLSEFDLLETSADISHVGGGGLGESRGFDNTADAVTGGKTLPRCCAGDRHRGCEGAGCPRRRDSVAVSAAGARPELSSWTVRESDLSAQWWTSRRRIRESECQPTPAQLRFLSSVCWAIGKLGLMTAASASEDRCKRPREPGRPTAAEKWQRRQPFKNSGNSPSLKRGPENHVSHDMESARTVVSAKQASAVTPAGAAAPADGGTAERSRARESALPNPLLAPLLSGPCIGSHVEADCNAGGSSATATVEAASAFPVRRNLALRGRDISLHPAAVGVLDGGEGIAASLCREMLYLLEASVAMCLDLFHPRQVAISLWGLAQCHRALACTLSLGSRNQLAHTSDGRLLRYWSWAAGVVHARLTELSLRELSVFAHTCCAVGYRDETLLLSIGSRMLRLLPISWGQHPRQVVQGCRIESADKLPNKGRDVSFESPRSGETHTHESDRALLPRQKARRWVATWGDSLHTKAKTHDTAGGAPVAVRGVQDADVGGDSVGGSVSTLLSAFAALEAPLFSCFTAVADLLMEDHVSSRHSGVPQCPDVRTAPLEFLNTRHTPVGPTANDVRCRTEARRNASDAESQMCAGSQGIIGRSGEDKRCEGGSTDDILLSESSPNRADSGVRDFGTYPGRAARHTMGAFLASLKPIEVTALAWAFATFCVGEQGRMRQQQRGGPGQSRVCGGASERTEKRTLSSEKRTTLCRLSENTRGSLSTSSQLSRLVNPPATSTELSREARSALDVDVKISTSSRGSHPGELRGRLSAGDRTRPVSDCDRGLTLRVLECLATHAVFNDRQYCLAEKIRLCWALALQDLYVPTLLLSVLQSLHQHEDRSPERVSRLFPSSRNFERAEAGCRQASSRMRTVPMPDREVTLSSGTPWATVATEIEEPEKVGSVFDEEPYDGRTLPPMLQTQFYLSLLSYLTRRGNTSVIRWPRWERAQGVLAAEREVLSEEPGTRLQSWPAAEVRGSPERTWQGPVPFNKRAVASCVSEDNSCPNVNRADKRQSIGWAFSEVDSFMNHMDAARYQPGLLPNSFFRCRASLNRHPDRASRSTLSQLHIKVLIVLRKVLQTERQRRQDPTCALIAAYDEGCRTTLPTSTAGKTIQYCTTRQVTLEHRDVTGISIDLVAWPPFPFQAVRIAGDQRFSETHKSAGWGSGR